MKSEEVREQQRERLGKTIAWARRIRSDLQPLLEAHGERVHFRPSSSGVTMVGLLPHRAQRGERFASTEVISNEFEALFDKHCRDIEQGRETKEKALQSFLIRDAQRNGRRLASINAAAGATASPVDLWFITDEIALPSRGSKMVCDILALRRDGARCVPVVIELKTERSLTRLAEQVGYASLVDEHSDLFAELFSALLGETIDFDAPAEKWIVWPARGHVDPQTQKLLEQRIRVVGYTPIDEGYSFIVGPEVPTIDISVPE